MVKQRLVSNFNTILKAKLFFFLKKSIWKYLILTFIMGYSLPIHEMNPVVSGLIYFLGVMVLLLPLQYLSAKRFSKIINFDAIVEFDAHEIRIFHNTTDMVEVQDWNWIKTIDINKSNIWLTINQVRPFAISIPKSKLDASEIALFEKQKIVKSNN